MNDYDQCAFQVEDAAAWTDEDFDIIGSFTFSCARLVTQIQRERVLARSDCIMALVRQLWAQKNPKGTLEDHRHIVRWEVRYNETELLDDLFSTRHPKSPLQLAMHPSAFGPHVTDLHSFVSMNDIILRTDGDWGQDMPVETGLIGPVTLERLLLAVSNHMMIHDQTHHVFLEGFEFLEGNVWVPSFGS